MTRNHGDSIRMYKFSIRSIHIEFPLLVVGKSVLGCRISNIFSPRRAAKVARWLMISMGKTSENHVHSPPYSYLAVVMYGSVWYGIIHCHSIECWNVRFWDTLGNTSNARLGIPASRHPWSYSVRFSHSSRYCAGVYLPLLLFVKLYRVIRDIVWHRLQFLVEFTSQAAIHQRPSKRRNECGERMPRKLLNFRQFLDWDFSIWWCRCCPSFVFREVYVVTRSAMVPWLSCLLMVEHVMHEHASYHPYI